MNLGYYLLNDDMDGFEKECQRLFGKKKLSSDDESNINKDNDRFSRSSYSDDLEL